MWLCRNQPAISELSSIRLLQKLLFHKNPVDTDQVNIHTQQVALEIFQDLQRANQTKNSTLVLVYLPMEEDYSGEGSEQWRQFLKTEAAKHNLLYIDLIDEFRELSPETIEKIFIAEGAMDFDGASGHYTEKGNAYIAETFI